MNINRLSRRSFLRVSAMTAAGAALISCAAPTAPAAADQAGAPAADNSIRFWMWNTYAPTADEVLEQGIQAWAAENGMTVEISRDSDSNIPDKVMPALEAGTLPDALFAGAGDALQMGAAGGLATVNDIFVEIGEEHGGWLPRLENYVTRDGEITFLPYSIDTPMMHFRQDIFDEAGIETPEGQWTWDQVRDLSLQAQQFTEESGDKKIGWAFGTVKQQHDGWCDDLFRNFGADLWDETGTRIILQDEKSAEAVRALTFIKEAYDMGLFPDDAASWDYSSNNTSYQEEQGIVAINAASIYVWAEENKPELAEATSLAPKPADVRDTTNASLRYTLVLSNSAANPEGAKNLIKGLYDSSIYAPWLEKGFVTNVVHEYDTLPMWTGKRSQFNLAANIGVYSGYPAPYDNAAMAELNGPNAPIGSMVVRVLVDGWTPEDAIAEADQFSKRVFEKYFPA
jgi:ABC-type glycerol-3-phosphate transport system substrate-binding protein